MFQECNVLNAYFQKCANMLLSYIAEYRKVQESDLGNREREDLYDLALCYVVYMNYFTGSP